LHGLNSGVESFAEGYSSVEDGKIGHNQIVVENRERSMAKIENYRNRGDILAVRVGFEPKNGQRLP